MGAPSLNRAPATLSHRGVNAIVIVAVFLALATVAIALRFYTQRVKRKEFIAADWLVLAAYLCFWGHAVIVVLVCAVGGLGFHTDALDLAYVVNNFKLGLGQEIVYGVELGFTKCSLCALFMNIFKTRKFRMAATCAIVLCVCWAVLDILISTVTCRPIAFYWDHSIAGTCGNISSAWTSVGSLDVIVDAIIMALPVPMLWKLNMPTRKKLGVMAVFGLGIVTIVVGILRTVFLARVDFADFTYDGYYIIVLTSIEPAIAITVVSSMALRPLLNDLVPSIIKSVRSASFRVFGSHSRSTNSNDNIGRLKHGQEAQGLQTYVTTAGPAATI